MFLYSDTSMCPACTATCPHRHTRQTPHRPAAGYRAGYRYRRAATPLALRKAPVPVPYRYLYSRYRGRPHCRLCRRYLLSLYCTVIRIPHRWTLPRYSTYCICCLSGLVKCLLAFPFPSLIWQQSYPAFPSQSSSSPAIYSLFASSPAPFCLCPFLLFCWS